MNHPVLSLALFIFIYLIITFEIKNITKKYDTKQLTVGDLVTKINEDGVVVLDTREKSEFKKGHISQAILYDISSVKNLE